MNGVAKDPDAKARRFFKLYYLRSKGELTEERIATEELNFGSAKALYKQLELDGSPVCGVCGQLYPEPDHREKHNDGSKKRKPGPPKSSKIRLPPASAASGLFKAALKELHERIGFVCLEESWLQGKRFTTRCIDCSSHEMLWRRDFTDGEWKELCERYGGDPEADEHSLPVGSSSAGPVGQAPSEDLASLVAAYALSDKPLTPLLEKLHPNVDSVDGEELREQVLQKTDKLRLAARHLAMWVRGSTTGPGAPVPEVPSEDHFAAWLIADAEKQGASSAEEISERVKKMSGSFASRLTPEEVKRIRHLGLRPPE